MPSLVAGQDMLWATGTLRDHFDTFSQQIIVHKEPKKTVDNTSTPTLHGYSSRRASVSYTSTPVSGIFSAIVNYNRDDQNLTDENGLQIRTPDGELTIKTTGGCKDFIVNGKTKNIEIDGKTFNLTSSYKVQKFFGLDYYYFTLTETN